MYTRACMCSLVCAKIRACAHSCVRQQHKIFTHEGWVCMTKPYSVGEWTLSGQLLSFTWFSKGMASHFVQEVQGLAKALHYFLELPMQLQLLTP